MKRDLVIFLMSLMLAASSALTAQSAGSGAHANPNLPLTGQQPVDEDADDTGTEVTSDTGHMHRDEVRENRELVEGEGAADETPPISESVERQNLNEPMGTTDPVDTGDLHTGIAGTAGIGSADPIEGDEVLDAESEAGAVDDESLPRGASATGVSTLDEWRSEGAAGVGLETLPATAGGWMGMALLGLLALAGSFALRFLRS